MVEIDIKNSIITDEDIVYLWFICPKCKNVKIRLGFNYCPHCGIEIKWIK
jgi:predicted RNA-binding Zn-ribbon protein involved in translation (DUF1610 family)